MNKTNLKTIPLSKVLIKEAITPFAVNLDLLSMNMRSIDRLIEASLNILWMFTLCPLESLYRVIKVFFSSFNPTFNIKKEYFELRYHSSLYCDGLFMGWETFCSLCYNYSRVEALAIIRDNLTNESQTLTGVILNDKMNALCTDYKLVIINSSLENPFYLVDFGNKVNRSLYSLYYKVIYFHKEGKKTYLRIPHEKIFTIERDLDISINLI